MMRKIVIILSIILLLFTAYAHAQFRVVTAQPSLRVRDSSGLQGKVLGAVPYSEKVDLLEETGAVLTIQGATGRWSKIRWKNLEGWVFGGFLDYALGLEHLADSLMHKTYKKDNGLRRIHIYPKPGEFWDHPMIEFIEGPGQYWLLLIKVEPINGGFRFKVWDNAYGGEHTAVIYFNNGSIAVDYNKIDNMSGNYELD
jgi:hypothetical protein